MRDGVVVGNHIPLHVQTKRKERERMWWLISTVKRMTFCTVTTTKKEPLVCMPDRTRTTKLVVAATTAGLSITPSEQPIS